MSLRVAKSSLIVIDELRRQRRDSIHCQIIRDSILPRGLGDSYLIKIENEDVGYAGVWTRHFPGRVMEFYVSEHVESAASDAFDMLVSVSGAHEAEAQTNIPLMANLLEEKCTDIKDENLLFGEPPEGSDDTSSSGSPGGHDPAFVFRRRRPGDTGPDGAWVVELDHKIVAAGGLLRHYNAPFGDIFMEVIPDYRLRGIGSSLIRKLRQHATEHGIRPAARCDIDNDASRKTLERGGMICCGRLQAGKII